MPDKLINQKDIAQYKKLLKEIDLQSVLGENLKPLIIGHLTEVFKGAEYSRPLIFAYKNKKGESAFIKIEDNDGNRGSICIDFRQEKYGGYEFCKKSDDDAFKKLFDCKIVAEMDKAFERIDDNPDHIGYCYQCSAMGLKEWIVPLFINDICVGAFISGRFYTGDPETYAEDLHAVLSKNCPEAACKFTVDVIKACDMPMPEPEQDERDRLFRKAAVMQNSMQKNYDNELARLEKLVLGQLISIIDGKNTTQSCNNKNIQDRLKYSRDLLCEGLSVLKEIFDLKESVVFTSDIKRNVKASVISGLQLNGSNRDNLDAIKQYLSIKKIKAKYTDSNDKGLFAHIHIRNSECREFFVDTDLTDPEKFLDCFLLIVAARSNMDCPMAFFISFHAGNEKKNTDRVISFLEHLSTAFLAQWNMLLAEQSQEDATNNIMYIRHEVREALSAQDGILRKIESRYRKTSLSGARNVVESYPDLPPAVSEFLEYIENIFFNDYSATIQILHDIIDNYNILTEELELSYKKSYAAYKMLNAIPPIFKHMQEFGYRWLERSQCWQNPVPHSIDIDPGKISQSIRNLIRNAQKYGYESTNILLDYGYEKGSTYREGGTPKVFFTVTSFGAEIPKAEHEKIFERGYRGRQHIGEQATGRGLGLYVARKIAELHNGTLTLIESEKESGLNIPLLLEYKKKYETNDELWLKNKGYKKEIYDKCIEELARIGEDKLRKVIYQSDKGQESKQSFVVVMRHKNSYLTNEIIQPTYRNTFKLVIPKQKEESQ